MDTEQTNQMNNLSTPIAIVIAGALLAGAVYFSDRAPEGSQPQQPTVPTEQTGSLDEMEPVTQKDHIRGNSDAPVVIVEYSDTECPFCKQFHGTMKRIVAEYGDKVAWVYRHFPLDQLHPKADKEAEALECAGELGGNDAFWRYADRLFEITPSNNGLDPAELPNIAAYIGLDRKSFDACLQSGKYAAHVEEEYQEALRTGGNGTPWSIVVAKNGKKYPLGGAQPYEAVKQIIDLALKGT